MTGENRRGLRRTRNDHAGVPYLTVAKVESAYRGMSSARRSTGVTSAVLIAQSAEQPPPRTWIREVVDGVVGLLSGLPASQWLCASGPLQAVPTEGLVGKAAQRRRGRP